MFDEITYKALELCIWKRIPFVLFSEPNSEAAVFYAAPSLLTCPLTEPPQSGFFICEFNRKFDDCVWIPFESDANTIWNNRFSLPQNTYADPDVCLESTAETDYKESVRNLVGRLEQRGEAKTVLSKVTARFFHDASSASLIENLFANSKDEFCSCYYHPLTGFWAGATPELLLSCDFRTGRFSTMALAGTLSETAEWDDKNMRENDYVSRHIETKLSSLGISCWIGEAEDVKFGRLKHICHKITGEMGSHAAAEIIDALNPTPALCGTPIDLALQDIHDFESHSRRCYGGYVGVRSPLSIDCYVNIRCFNFNKSHYCFYSGGGILPQSDPDTEWLEADSKMLNLQLKLLIS